MCDTGDDAQTSQNTQEHHRRGCGARATYMGIMMRAFRVPMMWLAFTAAVASVARGETEPKGELTECAWPSQLSALFSRSSLFIIFTHKKL